MILATFTRNQDGAITRYRITGHAFNGEIAHDVVCAGTSSLAINAVNSIAEFAGFEPIVEIDEVEGGFLDVEILADLDPKQFEIAQLFLQSLELGLQSIAGEEEYAPFIQVN